MVISSGYFNFIFADAMQTTSAYTVVDKLIQNQSWENRIPIHHAELYAFFPGLHNAYQLCDEHPDDNVAIAIDNTLVEAMYQSGNSSWLTMHPMQLLSAMTTIVFYKLKHGQRRCIYYVPSEYNKGDLYTRSF